MNNSAGFGSALLGALTSGFVFGVQVLAALVTLIAIFLLVIWALGGYQKLVNRFSKKEESGFVFDIEEQREQSNP